MKNQGLSRMKASELAGLASRLGIPLQKKMRKSALIREIEAFQEKEAAGQTPESSSVDAPGPATPLTAEESKFYTGPPHSGAWRLPAEIPHEYNSEKVALLVRDPRWAYTYWEVTQGKLDMERAALKDAGATAFLALRFYDVTGVMFDGGNAESHFDIGVYERVGSWYVNLGRPGRSFVADLGLKTRDGSFVMLARSNVINTPRDKVSDVLDEEWVLPESGFERIFALSGGYGTGHSSADVRLAAGGKIQFGIASPGISSLALMSPMMKRQRGFWFVLNTELIVYGATEPDAKVTLQGKPLSLRPDGTFTVRFALPDGTQTIPVSATPADEAETRWITPVVERHTH